MHRYTALLNQSMVVRTTAQSLEVVSNMVVPGLCHIYFVFQTKITYGSGRIKYQPFTTRSQKVRVRIWCLLILLTLWGCVQTPERSYRVRLLAMA